MTEVTKKIKKSIIEDAVVEQLKMVYDPEINDTGVYDETNIGYRGGWENFAPDEWVWIADHGGADPQN